ncbi:MAG: PhzF family phenazine biosynthesis protein [Acidobacteria bacterium]|nr:PhzF family phenazine biosynthesis protein [Acidobacteriota bacterium]MCL5286674.1 PhzF family phenazine biosynthesis protein [Acidobacteriota bacterium]
MKRRLYQLDVFTHTPLAGNPLAVITDGDGLATQKMQAIAREMNLSETVFIQKPTSDRALARLRIFTTTQELPLAGHPVIGTWFLLAELGVVPAQNGAVHVWQQTGAGVLPVTIEFKDGRPSRVTMTQKTARFFPARVPKAALMQSLGLKLSDLHASLPLEYVSTGIFNLMVPLRGRSVLKKIRMDVHALSKLISEHGTLAYCFALGQPGKVFARGMIPWELYEDPATGSAGGSLGAYLVRHKKLAAGQHLEITQGVEMGRTSHIHVTVQSDGEKLVPQVSGAAVRIFEGTIEA